MKPRALWGCIAAFATAGFLLRAVFAVLWPTIQRPDETFQNLEPAYRLVTGWGVVTWEWREGIRSWMFPGFLSAIMRLARLLDLPLLPAIAVTLAMVATSGVVVAVLLGWRRAGLSGAVLCGTLAAFWPDLVYFGPKPLLEVQAGTMLLVAACLASLDREHPPWRMAAIGLLLGLSFDLRFQLAPALAVVAIAAARRDLRHGWRPLLAAAAAPVLLLGLVDWATWGSPFQSIWKNIEINFFDNRADTYGVLPFYAYAVLVIVRYGVASLPLAICFALGVRAAPLLAATAAVVVAFHSLIAHKEVSFVYAALPCALIVAGLGATRLLDAVATPRPLSLAIATVLCALTASLAGLTATPFREPSAQVALRTLWATLRTRPDLCGLALYGRHDFPWFGHPGYVGLDRNVPIYALQTPDDLARAAPAFDYLIVDTTSVPELPEDQRVTCAGEFCLLHRPHACEPKPEFAINAVLPTLDQ